MKKFAYLFLLLISLAALAVPPWNMDWKESEPSPQTESVKPDRFVGWHDWTFIFQEHHATIAWDGMNTGGKVSYIGTPYIAYDIYLGETLLILLLFWGIKKVTHAKKKTS